MEKIKHEIAELLLNYVRSIKVEMNEQHDKSLDTDLELIFVISLLKNIDAIKSVSILLKHESLESSIFSIAATLRGSILNVITAIYFINGMNDSNEGMVSNLKHEIHKFNLNQIAHYIGDLKFLNTNNHLPNAAEIIKKFKFRIQ